MLKTLRLSFSLRDAYRVNSILYALKQIPLIQRMLPGALYQSRGLKAFAHVLSGLWEVLSAFLGKALYYLILLVDAGSLYPGAPSGPLMLHMLVFLTAIGAFLNTYLFNPTKDKYYAMILMRMDARAYTLANYGYALVKCALGFLPFALIFGLGRGVPLWLCLLTPLFVVGMKLTVTAISLGRYERTGDPINENRLTKWLWLGVALLLGAAYGLPALGWILPEAASAAIMAAAVGCGALSLRKVLGFGQYRTLYQEVLTQAMQQMDTAGDQARRRSQQFIATDAGITSGRRGFEYLNELFIKRHRRILWKASIRIAAVCLALVMAALAVFWVWPGIAQQVNSMLLVFLPYFVFIMYAVNRGTGFTQALFMNCDHSLLTYSFYKQPRFILKLFQIRLREIIKINLLPAGVIGGGLALLLFASGGTDNPVDYGVLVISILAMSVFFSVHYLTIYYLLQPYNIGTEMKSGTYQMVLSGTYLACFMLMRLQVPILTFGLMTIAFCVLYCVLASLLVYRLAPKTFRLRA
ncbi:MAG: hypothetical protein ACOYJA_04605 [Christensenellales bacterium]